MRNHPIIYWLLIPFSWVYGAVVSFRNWLFDNGILRSWPSPVPLVVIGNLVAGGTGKTPVVTWLTRELGSLYRIAILSRGYGRSSCGFQVLGAQPDPALTGDEPAELRMLLPETVIAIDRNRLRGIRKLTSGLFGDLDLILMDDGLQHRRVKPGLSIVLDNFNRPMKRERLLPAGLRRESLKSLKRSHLVVNTKIAENSLIELPSSENKQEAILITGIADARQLANQVSRVYRLIRHFNYPDHHRYTRQDIDRIGTACAESGLSPRPLILTTGKDYVKLIRFPELKALPLTILPAPTGIDPETEQLIINKIKEYVEQNRPNR